MKGETTQDVIFLLHFLVCFGVFAFDFIGCCGTVAVHFIRLTCGKGYWTSAKLCCRFTPLIQVVLHSCKKICSKRTGGLSDWIPADSILHQISRNREGWMMKGNKKKKAMKTRDISGIFSVSPLQWSLKSPYCYVGFQRWELTCGALGEKAVPVPSPLAQCSKQAAVLRGLLGKAQRGGMLLWKKSWGLLS